MEDKYLVLVIIRVFFLIIGHFYSCSAEFTSPIKIRNDIKGVLSTTPESNTFNKNQCISIEEKAKLNLKYCLYLEFVHSNCDEIKNNEKIHVSNGLYDLFY